MSWIPQVHVPRAIEGARARTDHGAAVLTRIEPLYEIMNIDAAVRAAGIEQVDATWAQAKRAS